MLGFFGGHLDPEEARDHAIVRELGEETSLDVSALGLRFIKRLLLPVGLHVPGEEAVAYIYGATVPDTNFYVFEGVGSEVYSIPEALKRSDLAATVRYILEQEM
jgi:8-oxo-dGTP pyrophosphatase MutT (NUDIX family)